MPNADYFADKAKQCRELIGRASNSYVAEQLRLWAEEFDLMAQIFSVRSVGSGHPIRRSRDDDVSGEPEIAERVRKELTS